MVSGFLLLLLLGPNFSFFRKILIHSIWSSLMILAAQKCYRKVFQRLKLLWLFLLLMSLRDKLMSGANCSFYANSDTHEVAGEHLGVKKEQQKIIYCASKGYTKESLWNWAMRNGNLDYNDIRQKIRIQPKKSLFMFKSISNCDWLYLMPNSQNVS